MQRAFNTDVREEDNVDNVCEFCGGTGFMSVDEDDGNGHIMYGVGSRLCWCKMHPNDGYEDD